MFDKAFDDLVSYLKDWEKFSATPYYATKFERQQNMFTIGYGTRCMAQIVPKYITESRASELLEYTLDSLQFDMGIPPTIKDHYEKGHNINSAILSLAYNMGPNGFPKLLQCIDKGDYSSALDQFYDGIYQAKKPVLGLIYRRACDAQIFEKGIYQRRDWITPIEKERFLRMNAKNKEAIAMINNRVKVQG